MCTEAQRKPISVQFGAVVEQDKAGLVNKNTGQVCEACAQCRSNTVTSAPAHAERQTHTLLRVQGLGGTSLDDDLTQRGRWRCDVTMSEQERQNRVSVQYLDTSLEIN